MSNREPSRHIPAAIKDKVYERDGGRCTFVGKNGLRCDATHDLQIDHIKPFGRGGGHRLDNLRLLCGKHNRLEAEQAYGVGHMNRFGTTKRESPSDP